MLSSRRDSKDAAAQLGSLKKELMSFIGDEFAKISRRTAKESTQLVEKEVDAKIESVVQVLRGEMKNSLQQIAADLRKETLAELSKQMSRVQDSLRNNAIEKKTKSRQQRLPDDIAMFHSLPASATSPARSNAAGKAMGSQKK